MAITTSTPNQQRAAYELLRKGMVRYHTQTGSPTRCSATVQSRSGQGSHECLIELDRRGKLLFRCDCQGWQFRPSRMCSHLLATYLIWKATDRQREATDGSGRAD